MNTLEQQFQQEFDSYQKYCDALFVVITRIEDDYLKDRLLQEFKTADKQKHLTFRTFLANMKHMESVKDERV